MPLEEDANCQLEEALVSICGEEEGCTTENAPAAFAQVILCYRCICASLPVCLSTCVSLYLSVFSV